MAVVGHVLSDSSPPGKRRLPIVGFSDELSKSVGPALARALRSCAVNSPLHRRLHAAAVMICRDVLLGCVAPSVSGAIVETFERAAVLSAEARPSSRAQLDLRALQAAATQARARTVAAVDSAIRLWERTPSLLDPHADDVVLRYAALAARHATNTALLVLESTTSPGLLADLPLQAGGAMAYRNCGLGPARDPQFRSIAIDHATAEHEESLTKRESAGALAVQLFHEFLGARWKDHCDAQRLRFEEHLLAALPDPRDAGLS